MKIPLTVWQIELIPWYVFVAYWAISWLRVKRTKTAESLNSRLATILPMVLVFELLFSNALRVGPLRLRFLPVEDWIVWSGIALTSLGVALAIWARYSIGQYWSARVTLKEGHRVIRSGPYAWVRHPIYTGILTGLLGTAMVEGQVRGIFAFLVTLAGFWVKLGIEEQMMRKAFGAEYEEYARRTGALVPRI